MLEPVTILTALAYAITKSAAADPNTMLGTSGDLLAQLFGGAAGNAFHGDLEKLRVAFLNITKPDKNQDLERAAARSALHANLFCLMVALGEPVEPAAGKLAQWRQCVAERLPQTLRDLRRPSGGLFKDAERVQLLNAKKSCEARLEKIETNFTPVDIDPNRMLVTIEDDYAGERAHEALMAIEEEHGRLPDDARDIFTRQWFAYLCGSFHYEIKHRQPVANILSSISLARVEGKIDQGFAELHAAVEKSQDENRRGLDKLGDEFRRYKKTVEGAPANAREGAAAERPVGPVTNLPASTSKFVGRAADAERVRRLIGENRLVTLAGPGGAGKTRLALEIAGSVLEDFPGGVWMVELASKIDPDVVPGAIADALGLREQASKPPTDALRAHLADKQLLILLDNCEHLIAACAHITDEILQHCPEVKILATSREVLNTEVQETVHWVGAMGLPDNGETASFEVLAESDAVRLFELRAKEASRFQLTPENAAAVATICRRLGGIPLALELAAARLKTWTPQQLAQHLDEALNLLVDKRRRGHRRKEHISVRETIRWSYNLLDDDQKRLMRRIAVFEGSLTADRVRGVCVPEWETERTLEALDELVEKSMVQVKSSPDGQERRLYLLETVQQFGVEELAACGELGELQARHVDYFLNLTEGLRPQLEETPNEDLLSTLAEAHDDVRVALQRSIDKGDVDSAMRLGAAFWRFWEIRGLLSEGRRTLAKLIAAPAEDEGLDARSRVLSGAGLLAFRQGDVQEAKRLFLRALEIEVSRADTNQARLAECLNDVGLAHSREGDIAVSIGYYSKYLALAEQHLGTRDVAVAHNNLGAAAFALGNLDEAEEHLALSRKLFQGIGNESDVAYPLTYLGAVSVMRDDPRAATAYLEQALEWRERLENTRGMAEACNWLGRAALCLDNQAEALVRLARGLKFARQVEGVRETADILDSMILITSARGEAERTVVLAAASDALRQGTFLPRLPVLRLGQEEAVERARSQLPPDAYEAAKINGSTRPLKEILQRYAYI